jgi:hypothetical protein
LVRVHVVLGELREHVQPLLIELQRKTAASINPSPSGQSPSSVSSSASFDSRSNVVSSHHNALRQALAALIVEANKVREIP